MIRCALLVATSDIQLGIYPPVRNDWVKRFLQCHPRLQTANSPQIGCSWWKDTTPEVISAWFDTFLDVSQQYQFELHNILEYG